MVRQSFIRGAMILLAAGVANRILGFVPRVALPRMIGAEGIGLYQMSYPIMIVILTLISGGIPLAVAKLVAEADAERKRMKIRKTLKIALVITVSLSLLFTALCLWFARYITSHWFTDSRVYYCFTAMTPILTIAGISSVFRGYFQGLHNMIPTAISQTIETFVRIAAVLLLAYLLLPKGVEYAAAGAMAGVVTGELFGLLALLHQYGQERRSRTSPMNRPQSDRGLLRRLAQVAVPVTASRLVGSGSYFLESILTVQNLAIAGVATAAATAQYGILQGMVFPIILLPTALTYSLAVSLVPSLSEAAQKKDLRTVHKRMHQSLRLSLVAGAPFAAVMYVLAEPLCKFVFNNAEAGAMLRMMAPIAIFIYFQGPLQAALQALDKPGTALRNTLIGAIVKLVLIGVLASNPAFGIMGVVIAINVNIALVTALHWLSISRMLRFSMPISDFLKVGLALALTVFSSTLVWDYLASQTAVKLAAAMTAGLVSYLIGCVWLGLIDRHDLKRVRALFLINK